MIADEASFINARLKEIEAEKRRSYGGSEAPTPFPTPIFGRVIPIRSNVHVEVDGKVISQRVEDDDDDAVWERHMHGGY